jgi:Spy/CpxP family protein refolding chaperone
VWHKRQLAKPGNLLGWEQELNLTEEQRARLRAIEDKATDEAKAMLTTEQQDKLKELSKSQSIMKCMGLMKHGEQTDGKIEQLLSLKL